MSQSMYAGKAWYCLCNLLLTDGQNKLLWEGLGCFLRQILQVVRQQQRMQTTTALCCFCFASQIGVKWTSSSISHHPSSLSPIYILSSDYSNKKRIVFDIYEIVVHWWISGKRLRYALIVLWDVNMPILAIYEVLHSSYIDSPAPLSPWHRDPLTRWPWQKWTMEKGIPAPSFSCSFTLTKCLSNWLAELGYSYILHINGLCLTTERFRGKKFSSQCEKIKVNHFTLQNLFTRAA